MREEVVISFDGAETEFGVEVNVVLIKAAAVMEGVKPKQALVSVRDGQSYASTRSGKLYA
jgi:hypothetical protein